MEFGNSRECGRFGRLPRVWYVYWRRRPSHPHPRYKTVGVVICARFSWFIAVIGSMLILLSPYSFAEPDDIAFNACVQILQRSHYKLVVETWHSSELPSYVKKVEKANLDGGYIVRWTSHNNKNGSVTYVVLIRAEPPDLHDDPDEFDVVFKQGSLVSIKDYVGADAFAFSATQNDGVNGLLFCTRGEISNAVWNWTGNSW